MEHERYTELVVLAAGGQLSGEEYDVLKAHVEVCASCRREFAEYQDMIFKQFPLAGSEWTEGAVGPQVTEAARDYKNRFMARAKAEGIPLSVEEKASNRTFWTILGAKLAWSPAYAYGTVLVLSLFSAFVAYRLHEARTMELTQSREKQDFRIRLRVCAFRTPIWTSKFQSCRRQMGKPLKQEPSCQRLSHSTRDWKRGTRRSKPK